MASTYFSASQPIRAAVRNAVAYMSALRSLTGRPPNAKSMCSASEASEMTRAKYRSGWRIVPNAGSRPAAINACDDEAEDTWNGCNRAFGDHEDFRALNDKKHFPAYDDEKYFRAFDHKKGFRVATSFQRDRP